MPSLRRALVALTTSGALALLSATARPEDSPAGAGPQGYWSPPLPPSPPPAGPRPWIDPPPRYGVWYRNTLLLVDGVAFGVGLPIALAGVSSGNDAGPLPIFASILSFVPLVFTGPIVHLAKGQAPRALASLGMRAAFFSAAAAIGMFASIPCDSSSDWSCRGGSLTTAMTLTMAAPVLLDGLLFSSSKRSVMGRVGALPVWPSVSPSGGGLAIGLAGRL